MGGTLARYAAAGAEIVCVTATRGELGEVVAPNLTDVASSGRLGEVRMDEMASAVACLGPIEVRWLGYRDSGMEGDPRNADPEAFCQAPLDEAAGRIARVIREVRPQVVLTLKSAGGGGHPDHLHAASATRLAFERAGDPGAWPEQLAGPDALEPWAPAKLYEWHSHTRTPLDRMARIRYLIKDRGPIMALPVIARAVLRLRPEVGSADGVTPPPVAPAVPEHEATASISVAPWAAARDAAIRSYRTQIAPTDEMLAIPPVEIARMAPTEEYTLLSREAPAQPEDDLFAGLEDACSLRPGPTATVGLPVSPMQT
jgi:mycothiol S-conjugate amidase